MEVGQGPNWGCSARGKKDTECRKPNIQHRVVSHMILNDLQNNLNNAMLIWDNLVTNVCMSRQVTAAKSSYKGRLRLVLSWI
jgi:hypothetical protein